MKYRLFLLAGWQLAVGKIDFQAAYCAQKPL